MHIKKFEGRDLTEALAQIREELGPDAVILETAHQQRPRRGVTVLAALPRENGVPAGAGSRQAAAPDVVQAGSGPAIRCSLPPRLQTADLEGPIPGASRPADPRVRTWSPFEEVPRLASARGRSVENDRARDAAGLRDSRAAGLRDYRDDFGDRGARDGGLRDVRDARDGAGALVGLREVTAPFPTVRSAPPDAMEEETRTLKARIEVLNRLVRSDHFSAVPLPLRQLYFDLTDAEVDANLVFRILEKMGSAPIPGRFTPAPPGELRAYLTSLVRTGGANDSGARRVIALVGPTGVGKTTTLAKIAGDAAFHRGLSVALVSSDAYRVFGAQHLAAYAALMGLPFFAVDSVSRMRALLAERLANVDLVLIDTTGRSPNDPGGIGEIRRLLEACPGLDVHLALSANTRARDLALALDAFSVLPIRHLVFTKLDEASARGGMFTTALKARCPISWLGTGQEVPDDLEVATPAALTQGLLEETSDGRPGR